MDLERGSFLFQKSEVSLGADPMGPAQGTGPEVPRKARVALVGTYLPRPCGIATFGADVVEQVSRFHPEIEFTIYALENFADARSYDPGIELIEAGDPASYRHAADRINASGVDAVWLQHEYGIFGGPDGEMVSEFVERLAAPLVLTLHTVLANPSERQRAILEHLLARASRVMVMSRYSFDLLAEHYGAPRELMRIIEHGAPDRPYGRSTQAKREQGLGERPVLMTFGLLGPGKGLEHAIDAMPAILERHPQALYRIVGATHPVLAARDGEAYREMLMERAQTLGVDHAIEWENRFLDTSELLDRLEASDIFLTPYSNLQQSTSGTLSYAVALGKAVIATPYIHARELLGEGVGVLIEPNCPVAIEKAVDLLLVDPAVLAATQRRAWERGRMTIWPRFAEGAVALVQEAVVQGNIRAPISVVPRLTGVFAMSDGTGMLQHAIGTVPDRSHGYCLDDNARALMLMNVAEGVEPRERQARALTYASFVQHAWNAERGRFRNFMNFDRSWCEDCGSDDSNGRALWALGQAIETSADADLRSWARRWYDTALPTLTAMRSPRAIAFVMLGCACRLRRDCGHKISRATLESGGNFLLAELDAARTADWNWFERRLGYDNPRLSQALIEAGTLLERPDMVAAGLETAQWLAALQTGAQGYFRPIGSNGLGCDYDALPFDQQPLEAQAAIDCARSAFNVTGDRAWSDHAMAAWRWFFGANDRGVVLGDLATGRCRDGINPRGRNENCGAESILALHLARHSMQALQAHEADDSTGVKLEPQPRPSAHPVPHS